MVFWKVCTRENYLFKVNGAYFIFPFLIIFIYQDYSDEVCHSIFQKAEHRKSRKKKNSLRFQKMTSVKLYPPSPWLDINTIFCVFFQCSERKLYQMQLLVSANLFKSTVCHVQPYISMCMIIQIQYKVYSYLLLK